MEDERVVARDLERTLTQMGYTISGSVATGEDAVLRCRETRPSLVLMDIHLAGVLDGVQAAERIAAELGTPIIYLTAHSDNEILRRAKATQPFGYLVKPYRAAELRCAIEIAIHKHEIETRLRERQQCLATTLQAIGEGVIATDAQRKVRYLNRVAEALTGWTHEEAIGKELDEILGLVVGTDTSAVSRPIEDDATPILDASGKVVGGVTVLRDMNEPRRAEEIRRLNAEVERRVLERTSRLEAANKELEAFSYSVAHDLRAPLRGIGGFSQALIEDHAINLGPEGSAHLQRVVAGVRHMSQLIDDLLRLASVAKSDYHRGMVDLSRLVHDTNTEVAAAHPGRVLRLEVQEGLVVPGDESLLRILLYNMLDNAWKFTARVSHPRVEFGTVPMHGEPTFFIHDNGIGFDMQHAHKLFRAFQRLHSRAEFEGTGVGLAIVHRIVHRHGGRIWAQSEAGIGTTFYFTLAQPVRRAPTGNPTRS